MPLYWQLKRVKNGEIFMFDKCFKYTAHQYLINRKTSSKRTTILFRLPKITLTQTGNLRQGRRKVYGRSQRKSTTRIKLLK